MHGAATSGVLLVAACCGGLDPPGKLPALSAHALPFWTVCPAHSKCGPCRMKKLMHRVTFPWELRMINTTDDCPDAGAHTAGPQRSWQDSHKAGCRLQSRRTCVDCTPAAAAAAALHSKTVPMGVPAAAAAVHAPTTMVQTELPCVSTGCLWPATMVSVGHCCTGSIRLSNSHIPFHLCRLVIRALCGGGAHGGAPKPR